MQDANYPSLKDKVVLVSGGASGIGESIVRHFARQGSKVGFLDIADEAAKKLIADLGPDADLHYEHCDVTDIAAREARHRGLSQGSRPVHRSDQQRRPRPALQDRRRDPGALGRADRGQYQAPVLRAQAIYPDMKAAGGGAIVNFRSTAWMTGDADIAAYTSAKAGVIGLTRSLARDLACTISASTP